MNYDIDSIMYTIICVMFISYLLGLLLSYLEKKGKSSILSSMGNAGFINIFGVNTPTPEQIVEQRALDAKQKQQVEEKKTTVDEEII